MLKIVSLISSATEILCSLGLEENLVGISHECDYPERLKGKGLPILSEPKINPQKPSYEIDRDVRALVKEGLSVYRVKTDVLETLAPDLIVTQDQCEVCAVSLKDVEDAVCKLTKSQAKICTLHPDTLDDIPEDFRRVGKATGREKEAENLVTDFWIRLNQVNAKVGTTGYRRPRVICIEWLSPTIIAGSWLPELTVLAGGEPLIVTGPGRFQTVTWEEIQKADPDIVVILPCGYDIGKTLEEMKAPEIQKELRSLRAVKEGMCFVCDGNAYFNRPGPRIADSCEILASIFHPEKTLEWVRKHLNKSYVAWSPK